MLKGKVEIHLFALESNTIIYIPLIIHIPRHKKRGPGISISARLLRRAF